VVVAGVPDDELSPPPPPPQPFNIRANTIRTDHNKKDFFIITFPPLFFCFFSQSSDWFLAVFDVSLRLIGYKGFLVPVQTKSKICSPKTIPLKLLFLLYFCRVEKIFYEKSKKIKRISMESIQ
jgi:hypothetical protein